MVVVNTVLSAAALARDYVMCHQADSKIQLCILFLNVGDFSMRCIMLTSQSMFDFHNLSVTRDFTLYHQIIKPSHCLHCLLPCEKNLSQCMSHRPRGHDFILPTCKYELFKSTFINRCLYSFI